MKLEDRQKLFAALSAPFPEEAVERTDGRTTGKGYATSGIKAQYIINRLTAVLGVGGWRIHREITVHEVTTSSGRKCWEALCDLVMELGSFEAGTFVPFAEGVGNGNHTSVSRGDAVKGALTNAIKRVAAFVCGAGWQAYCGLLDEDNIPADLDDQAQGHRALSRPAQQPPPQPTSNGPTIIARPAPASAAQTRSRLSSKQLGMVWGLARKLGFEQSTFRGQVKQEFGAALEFLTREQASQLITRLTQKASNGNGHPHQANGELEQPPAGMEG